MLMSGVERARKLFQKAGLAFPKIPAELAVRLEERHEWLFSTRKIQMSPYNLQHYVREAEQSRLRDYVILSHTGHGVNSYAIQYYLVRGALRMFLHLGWGGAYMNAQEEALKIRDCFGLADKIVREVRRVRDPSRSWLTVVASDFYGSYWLPPGQVGLSKRADDKAPVIVLAEVLDWLDNSHGSWNQGTGTCEEIDSD